MDVVECVCAVIGFEMCYLYHFKKTLLHNSEHSGFYMWSCVRRCVTFVDACTRAAALKLVKG